jgi:hypothetical protein
MKDALRPFFSHASVDMDAVKSAAAKQFATESVSISATTIASLSQSISVEAFPLSKPVKENQFKGVSMYVDEAGQLKHLPANNRATGFANLCGFRDVPFLGDVFLSRVGPTDTGQKNLDFELSG